MATTKWTYSFSNLGPKKQIAGTTFYKVNVGSDVKWLSMEGIRMLEKAKAAGVKFKTVRKAVTHFTAHGTSRRLKAMRSNIEADLQDLLRQGLEGFDFGGQRVSGLMEMLKLAGLDGLAREFSGLLSLMNEEQLRAFFNQNRLLLQKFFDPSKLFRKYGSTENALQSAIKETRENGQKLRNKMLKMLNEDMTQKEILGIKDATIRGLLLKYRSGKL